MKQRRCMIFILAALMALGLGQSMGLVLGKEVSETKTTDEIPAVQETEVVYGYVVRQEIPVYAPYPDFWETEKDGQRVSSGTVLFRRRESRLRSRKEALIKEAKDASQLTLPRRRKNIHAAIAEAQESGDTAALMAYVLGENPDILEDVGNTAFPERTVTSEVGGIFVSGRVQETDHPDWPELPKREAASEDGEMLGRIITGETWWFYGDFSEGQSPGKVLMGTLPEGEKISLQVLRSEPLSEGGARMLLSCDTDVLAVARTGRIAIEIFPEE